MLFLRHRRIAARSAAVTATMGALCLTAATVSLAVPCWAQSGANSPVAGVALPKGAARNSDGALPSGITPVADNAFKDLDDWDVRLDGVKKRQAKLEVYFTVKNTTAKPQRFSAVRMTASDVDGVSGSQASTLYRASGATREQFTEAVDVEPGGEMRVCFIVSLPSANVALKKLTGEVNGGGSQTWDISGVR